MFKLNIDVTIGLQNVERYMKMGEVEKAKKLLAIIERLHKGSTKKVKFGAKKKKLENK